MRCLSTTCSRRKSGRPGLLPARRRYRSTRSAELERSCLATGRPGLFLSGRFGLVALDTPIPWYDQALRSDDVASLVDRVTRQLTERGVTALTLLHLPGPPADWQPYVEVLEHACRSAGIPLELAALDSDAPDGPSDPDGEMGKRWRSLEPCILFDWGDTLMRDLPDQVGPMADWPRVEVLPGAAATLTRLRPHARLAVATNAADSSELAVWRALARGGLDRLVDTVYCSERTGATKPSAAFFRYVLEDLAIDRERVWMVGDNLENDILGAQAAGIRGIWLDAGNRGAGQTTVPSIRHLDETPAALARLGLPSP